MNPNDLPTKEDLKRFRQEIVDEFNKIVESHLHNEPEWLRSDKVKELLSISNGTLENFITKGILKPRKISGIRYFERKHIQQLFK